MAISAADFETHRRYLQRVAYLQLSDQALAEDAVQDTLLAALQAKYDGKSSLKTWLTGILKHKIIDLLRKEGRYVGLSEEASEEINDDAFDTLFLQDGHWTEAPETWPNPEHALTDRQFRAIFEQCCQRLPRKHAQVFMMREVMDIGIEEICSQLEVSASNASVILYRARMSLRLCVDQRWFAGQREAT